MPAELEQFLASWNEDANQVKPLFVSLYSLLKGLADVRLEYKGRPGVSHSLRALYPKRADRPLFVLLDIIDDEPEARGLSICFYADLVTDPQGLGDVVPGGLAGEDACCFDIDAPEGMERFMLDRLTEAYATIASQA